MIFSIGKKQTKTLVIPVYSEKEKINFFETLSDKNFQNTIRKELKDFAFNGEKYTTQLIKLGNEKMILVGLPKEYSNEDLRKAYSNVTREIQKNKEAGVSIMIPKESKEIFRSAIDGIDLTNYKFDKYMSKKKDEKEVKTKIQFVVSSKLKSVLDEAQKTNSNVKLVRNLVNDNSDLITPKKLESIVREFSKKNKLKFKSLDEKAIQKEKLNLLWAVGRGSVHPPRLIIVEYNGNPKSKEKTALVGKGITFDTGGTNLKPTNYIEEMRSDMGGSATVFGAFKTAVELKMKKNLILVMSCAENAIDGKAFKPGDVFKSMKGITVEIGNTDAEGRLVLADALTYVQKHYKPTNIIDMATLTGACLVSLGPSLIAILGNDDNMINKIKDCGEETGDRGWQLPIHDEHRNMIKSKYADIKNIGGRFGGTITAAAFLERFIEDKVKWVHLDIAGAAFAKKSEFYNPELATGRGVRLVIEYLK